MESGVLRGVRVDPPKRFCKTFWESATSCGGSNPLTPRQIQPGSRKILDEREVDSPDHNDRRCRWSLCVTTAIVQQTKRLVNNLHYHHVYFAQQRTDRKTDGQNRKHKPLGQRTVSLPWLFLCLGGESWKNHWTLCKFRQKSDCGFPYFSSTKLLLLPNFSRHFVHLYINKNIT